MYWVEYRDLDEGERVLFETDRKQDAAIMAVAAAMEIGKELIDFDRSVFTPVEELTGA